MFFVALHELHMMFCEIKNFMLYFLWFHKVFHSYCNKKLICIKVVWCDSMKYYQHSGNQPEKQDHVNREKIKIYQLPF